MSRYRTVSLKDLQKSRWPSQILLSHQSPIHAKPISFFTTKRRAASPKPSHTRSGDHSSQKEKRKQPESQVKSPTHIEDDPHVASSFELWVELNRLDRTIRSKVDLTYISSSQLKEQEIKAKIEEVENAPKHRLVAKKKEGIEYVAEGKQETRSEETSPAKRRTRSSTLKTDTGRRSVHSILRREQPIFLLKTRKMIQKDIQQTMETSFQFLQSAHSMSRELSRCFIKAPNIRPQTRAVLSRPRTRVV